MIETWGKNRRSLQGKRSKQELISEIGHKYRAKTLDIGAMTNKDLTSILEQEIAPDVNIESVKSKRKKEYIEQLSKTFPTVKGLDKVPVSGLDNLLEAVCQKCQKR